MTEPNPLGVDQPAPRRDNQDPALFGQTPSQTVGPFFHYGLPWKGGADLVGASGMGARPDLFGEAHYVLHLGAPRGPVAGEVVELRGRVLDGEGAPVPDAMLEIWGADAAGLYAGAPGADPEFVGFGRAAVSAEGEYRFRTVRPGRVPAPGGGLQAAHLAVSVFGRGLLRRLATRVYFAGDAGLDDDPVLSCVPPARRPTLIARPDEGGWRLDIVLQGAGETVFFAF